MFFTQKLKCNFFKESDKGTSFFHALMSHKHRKNFIPAIQLSNGNLFTSVDEVGDAFVSFFKELLSTSKDTLPLDVEVSRSGPCIDIDSYSSLLAPVTNDDIKVALFNIDDNKAPGPDGYSSCFFKKA